MAENAVAVRRSTDVAVRPELSSAMTGAPMVGDPRFDDTGGKVLMRRACLYAAEMMRGKPPLPDDLSGFDAVFVEPATVLFIRADKSQEKVARFTVPDHVMGFPASLRSIRTQAGPVTITSKSPVEQLLGVLMSRRFSLTDEKRLQGEIAAALTGAGLSFEREVKLAPGSIIDFLVGPIGLEVKIKGAKRAIYRQCARYCDSERVETLVLATNASLGMPAQIGNKPIFVHPLGRAWL